MARQQAVLQSVHEPPDLAQSVAKLTEEVSRLADEVRVLRDAIDDFRGEYEWAVRHVSRSTRQRHIVQLASMAAGANGKDWKEKLNSRGPTITPAKAEEATTERPPTENSLW